jgi:SAM-dependent methyltransferase
VPESHRSAIPGRVLGFGVTLGLSAFLMFSLEPFVGRLLLPLLGGSPSVWNTCILFFQAVLLAGYAWAHLGPRLGGERRHALLHAGLMLVSMLFLPIGLRVGSHAPDPRSPISWLLGSLTLSVGLPFVVLASTGPLLQRWFSRTGHREAGDPYFLYAASNLGSLAGLLAYPAVVERQLALHAQSLWWSMGYVLVAVLTGVCAIESRPFVGSSEPEGTTSPLAGTGRGLERLRWLLLAAAPASLLLGVTTYLTTDIAAIPLLWVVPLAVYLLTFIIAFARVPVLTYAVARRWQPLLVLVLIVFLFWGDIFAVAALLPFHLLTFFATALLCHSALAAARPPAGRLTEYYLWIAAGGAVGGLFNVLVAPVAFDAVLEYPLVLALACGIGAVATRPRAFRRELVWPLVSVVIMLGARQVFLKLGERGAAPPLGVMVLAVVASCVSAVAFYRQRARPAVFSAALTILVLAGYATQHSGGNVLLVERDFYGVKKVSLDSTLQGHILYNGSTKHGQQNLTPRLRATPVSYYARSGPVGDVFARLPAGGRVNVGIVGLGAGGLTPYARAGERWTYFELDPEVERIARDPRYFTYLADSRAPVRVVVGDGRLSLGKEPDRSVDLLVLDAFSSDAIPIHLLTREALRLYLQKLAPGGVLLVHLSNRYLDLGPVLATLVQDAGLLGWWRFGQGSASDFADPAKWAVVARRRDDVGSIASDRRWRELTGEGARVWTDEYSNVLGAMTILRGWQ